jgi:hypothetical protein
MPANVDAAQTLPAKAVRVKSLDVLVADRI